MNKFGFIVHPLEFKHIHDNYPFTKFIPKKILFKIIKYMPPTFYSKSILNFKNAQTEGTLVMCPLLPKHFKECNQEFVNKKILSAINYAKKLNVTLVGLGAYTSVVGDKGISLSRLSEIPLTTGNSYTVWTVVNSCIQAAEKIKLDKLKAKVSVIGATGSIGSACTKLLSENFKILSICSPNQKKLEDLKKYLIKKDIIVTTHNNPLDASRDADIIVTATSAPMALLKTSQLKPGVIVCDVAMPPNILVDTDENRLIYIKGGLAKLPCIFDFGLNKYIPKNTVFSCIAETALLSLENNCKDVSLGENLSKETIEKIGQMAIKYNFQPLI